MAKVSRETILDAAVHLFNQNGYHATSMQDVANAVAIKKPSLYHHFESKEAILLAILEGSMERLIDEMASIANSQNDCATKLRDAVRTHASAIAQNPESAAIFFREDRGLGDAYLARYIEKRDEFEFHFRTIIQEGITSGEFRDTDVAIAVEAIMGMINWMTRWYRPQGRLNAEQIAGLFSDLFLNGLHSHPYALPMISVEKDENQ